MERRLLFVARQNLYWAGLSVVAVIAAALLACTVAHEFTPTSGEVYAPYPEDHTVQVLDAMPDTAYVLLGYVESRGMSMGQAMPYLLELARENGGDAIVDIGTEAVGSGVFLYRGALIRYK